MKTGAGLGLVAVGAILAFAVTAHPSGLNLQAAGLGADCYRAGGDVRAAAWLWLAAPPDGDPRGAPWCAAVPARAAVPASVLTSEPGTVVTTEQMDEVPMAGLDPAVYPGRQLSKAEAEEMGLTPVETVEEFRQE